VLRGGGMAMIFVPIEANLSACHVCLSRGYAKSTGASSLGLYLGRYRQFCAYLDSVELSAYGRLSLRKLRL